VEQAPTAVRPATPTRRDRDIANHVIIRPVRPVIIGSVAPDNIDAEAYARHIGNWGNHSGHLGRRWEEVVARWAALQVGGPWPFGDVPGQLLAALPLDSESALQRELSRLGLSCPDFLFMGVTDTGRGLLRAADSKVSLDTASLDQVQHFRLLELAEHGGPLLRQALCTGLRASGILADGIEPTASALVDWMKSDRVLLLDGLFASPNNGFNRFHLKGSANLKRRRPLTASDVVLISTTEEEYLGGLPGWNASCILRALDRNDTQPVDLSIAERYYRLGAGLTGAINTVEQPLFGPQHAIDTIARLKDRIEAAKPHSSTTLVDSMQRELVARHEPVERRKRLDRYPVPFRDILLRAQKASPVPVVAEQLRPVLEPLIARYRSALHDRGTLLLASGRTEGEVIERLELESAQRLAVAQADVEKFISTWKNTATHTHRG